MKKKSKENCIELHHGYLFMEGVIDAEVIDESPNTIGDVTLRVYGEGNKILADFHYIWATTAKEDLKIIKSYIQKEKKQ